MARSIQDIQQEILTAKANEPALAELNSTSKTAIWRLWVYITAFAIWTLERLFDQHKKEVAEALSELKPHTARWYRNKALAFQYGFDLLEDSDKFSPLTPEGGTYSEEQIANSRIVKYSAVTESETESRLIVKIATEQGGELMPITSEQKASFEAYMNEIKDAGVKITTINYLPDKLALNFKIFRDAKILDKNGFNILNGTEPIREALESFMKELPFNGELVLNKLIDKLQSVPGVVNPHLISAQTAWVNAGLQNYGNYEWINISKVPESGYFQIDWDNTKIEYIVTKTL